MKRLLRKKNTCSLGLIASALCMLGLSLTSFGGGGNAATLSGTLANSAYVTPAISATSIDQFSLGSDGLLSSSTTAFAASNSQSFGQMTFATVNGVQYAYILDPNGAVYWCSVNADGSFTNCAATASLPPFGTWQPRGVAFSTINALYAYIVDPGNNVVYQCAVGPTGDFTACQQNSLSTLAPYGIALAADTNATQHSYIADAGSGSGFGDVLLCSMQNDGSFNTCTQTPTLGAPNWIPYGIAFTDVNGTQFAYVADNGAGTPGHVYRCALNNDGSFVNSSCTQTPANDSSLTNWYPYQITFHAVNGTKYAYVVNSSGSTIGNIYRCSLDSNGLLTNCVLTPTNPPPSWQPSGIAFPAASANPPAIRVTAQKQSTGEGRDVQFTIGSISGPVSQNTTVYYTLSGSAHNGSDYTVDPQPVGQATIPSGQFAVTVTIHVTADRIREGKETITLTLTNNPTYTTTRQYNKAKITIAKNRS